MDLKPGYKQTEVGVIPEDWEVKRLDALVDIRSGGTPSTTQTQFWDGDILWCTPTDITALKGRKYIKNTNRKITYQGLMLSSAELIPANSIIMTSRATIGECAINSVPISTNQGFKNFIPLLNVDVEFMYYLILTKKQDFINLCSGSTFLEINKTQLSGFKLQFPSTNTEQKAIAEAFSDADNLIESLENLITKKRCIKQGAMQELLRPKKGWASKNLGEIALFYKGKGLAKSEIDSFGTEPCIHYGELFTKYPESIVGIQSRTNSKIGRFRSIANDVLMPTSDVTPHGLATASCILQDEVILGGDILVIRAPKNQLNGSFLSYTIRWSRDQVMQLVTGTTVYHLYGSDMKKFFFSMPEVKEQENIVNILSDMDAEIEALETKLTKIRQLKQGMMHNLLTGKIRLVSQTYNTISFVKKKQSKHSQSA